MKGPLLGRIFLTIFRSQIKSIMKKNFEDFTYFFTMWLCVSVIVLYVIGMIFKLLTHIP